jgi:homoserine O-succinyltransferase
MPIKIPNNLPARSVLESEGVMVMLEKDAVRQDIRPMRIGLLNLMPNKVKTETQFARLLGASPLQVELTLVKITGHVPRNTSSDHIGSFYRAWEDVRDEKFDGFIVTGAPVETLPFEDVTYWDELRRIFDWTLTNVHASMNICWGAQASVHHFHGSQNIRWRRRCSASIATASWRRPHPICADSRTTSQFRCRAGPR